MIGLEETDPTHVAHIEHESIADLFAQMLITDTTRVLAQGLDRGYITHTDTLVRLRGQIDVSASIAQLALPCGRAVCHFDELTPDVLHNRILRTTIGRLMWVPDLDKDLAQSLRVLHRQLAGVSEVSLSAKQFACVRLHANNRSYQLLMHCCRFVYDHRIADPQDNRPQRYRFRELLRDEKAMARLFESFLLEFYRKHRPDLNPASRQLRWGEECLDMVTGNGPTQLPLMKTDITLTDKARCRTLVMDAKYYRHPLSGQFGDEGFRSSHVYQLMAYLHATAKGLPAGHQVEGMLVYVGTDSTQFDRIFRVGRFGVRLVTVDLSKAWWEIEERLKNLRKRRAWG